MSVSFFTRLVVAAAVVAAPAARVAAQAPTPEASPSPTPIPRFNPDVVKALPTAGSLTARIVQLNAGLVLEREEGAGLFPAEPSRFAFRGGSWTQSRIEIDGFDVTDPFFGGRPLVWGAVELGEIDVRTDAKGTVLTHDHAFSSTATGTHFVAQANLGLFDSTGTSADPIPSLARGNNLFDGYLAASGISSSGDTTWSGALSGADVSRAERESDLERGTQRLGLEGRLRHVRGEDAYRALGMYQGARHPFGFTTAETRSKGLLFGGEWTRHHPADPKEGARAREHTEFMRFSFLRGSTDDPELVSSSFERLVSGPVEQQIPYQSNTRAVTLQTGGRTWNFGAVRSSAFFTWRLGSSDRSTAEPVFRTLERLNGTPAREWTISGDRTARLSQNQARFDLQFDYDVSDRSRLVGSIGLQRLTVGDRDGERLLWSASVPIELRFEWRKSQTTALTVEGSLSPSFAPLASFESATLGVPSVSARLWRDLNGDGQATPNELGNEVARRGPGSVTADPDLSLPTMKRVMVSFQTKLGPLFMHATAYARRDVNLIETALQPQGAEILRTRNIPDPSGDIVGPTDDQILPIVEESNASFRSSRYLLTNPDEHRALGEGAELGFQTNARHIHWGLTGAAFRASGRGGNRGLRVGENDFGVVGESFDRANADTYGYGRLFFDRAYSLRMHLTANDVRGFTFGAIARYDDGQPFARLVIQNDLPQGPDFVQAIARGRARLHYTLSVDARLAKRFKLSNADLEVSASVFNALGSQFEAEEYVTDLPPAYRTITMVQPPRAFVIGIRIGR